MLECLASSLILFQRSELKFVFFHQGYKKSYVYLTLKNIKILLLIVVSIYMALLYVLPFFLINKKTNMFQRFSILMENKLRDFITAGILPATMKKCNALFDEQDINELVKIKQCKFPDSSRKMIKCIGANPIM